MFDIHNLWIYMAIGSFGFIGICVIIFLYLFSTWGKNAVFLGQIQQIVAITLTKAYDEGEVTLNNYCMVMNPLDIPYLKFYGYIWQGREYERNVTYYTQPYTDICIRILLDATKTIRRRDCLIIRDENRQYNQYYINLRNARY